MLGCLVLLTTGTRWGKERFLVSCACVHWACCGRNAVVPKPPGRACQEEYSLNSLRFAMNINERGELLHFYRELYTCMFPISELYCKYRLHFVCHSIVFAGKAMTIQQLIQWSREIGSSYRTKSLVDIIVRVLLEFDLSPSIHKTCYSWMCLACAEKCALIACSDPKPCIKAWYI